MLTPVMDVVIRSGSKAMVNVQFLNKLKEHLRGLPEKPKELFEFQEAANYIRKDITSAFHKNYTQNDLSDMFFSLGWPQDDNSIRSFWRAFNALVRNIESQKLMAKSPDDYDVKYSKEVTKKKCISASKLNEIETSSSPDVPIPKPQKKEVRDMAPVNPDTSSIIQNSGAHFELPPDTEDI